MRYGVIALGLTLAATATALGQDIPRHTLERMGLGSMQTVRVVRVGPAGTPTYVRGHPPIVYGHRQHAAYSQQRQNLKRTAWRIAHRASRF